MHDLRALSEDINRWSRELGFQQAGIAGVELGEDESHLRDWLAKGQHGEMDYMARHGDKRSRPAELQPGTLRVISVRMDYGTGDDAAAWSTLADGERAYVARYALGRDYHKLMRNRLQKLADRIGEQAGLFGYRVYVDSAPVLERALARNAGLGWIGKNACVINKGAGSWFFLGEIYTDLPLPEDVAASAHCGTCSRCIDICPTQAIVAPNRIDARRCISYLTIELKGPIPEEFRVAIGNRIFGCDDCQLVCPWNKFAKRFDEPDFRARNELDQASLAQLFAWSELEFLERTEGSAIRRTGYESWLRNIAVALGNAPATPEVMAALQSRRDDDSAIVREHVDWALRRHGAAA
jgi:epoxyqueuosine reductase